MRSEESVLSHVQKEENFAGKESMEAGSDNTLKIISKLHKLAIDPQNRQLMGEDESCIETILSHLHIQSDEVIYKALETLSYLVSHSERNRSILGQNQLLRSKLLQVGTHSLKAFAVADSVKCSVASVQ